MRRFVIHMLSSLCVVFRLHAQSSAPPYPNPVTMSIHPEPDKYAVLDSLLKVPSRAPSFQTYEKLEINSPHIKKLPGTVCLYKNITWLEIEMPALKQVPVKVCCFEKLKKLDIVYSGKTALPGALEKLPALEELYISCDSSANGAILSNVKKLKGLKRLEINGVNIPVLPESFSELRGLNDLFINKCNLRSADLTTWKMVKLIEIDLSGNHLSEIPKGLAGFSDLVIIDLSSNKITSLPDDVAKEIHCSNIILDDNQITQLPDDISGWTGIQKLSLRNNPLPDTEKERLKKTLPGVMLIFD